MFNVARHSAITTNATSASSDTKAETAPNGDIGHREQFRLDDEHDHRPYRVSEVRKERGDGGADTRGGLNI
jgi:hypothetical protein